MDTNSKVEILTDEIRDGILDKLYPQYSLSKGKLRSHYYNSEYFTRGILEQVVRGSVKEDMLMRFPQTDEDIQTYIDSPQFEKDFLDTLNSGSYKWLDLFKTLTNTTKMVINEEVSIPLSKMGVLDILLIKENLYKDETYTTEEIHQIYNYVQETINPLVYRKVNQFDYLNVLTKYIYHIFGRYVESIYNQEDVMSEIKRDIVEGFSDILDLEYEYIRPTSTLLPYLNHLADTVRDGIRRLHEGSLNDNQSNERLNLYVEKFRDVLKSALNSYRHEFKDANVPNVEVYMDMSILGDYLLDMTVTEHKEIATNVLNDCRGKNIDYTKEVEYVLDTHYKKYIKRLLNKLNLQYTSGIKLPQTEKLRSQEGDSVNIDELKAFEMAEYRHNALRDLLYYKGYDKTYEDGYKRLYRQRKHELRTHTTKAQQYSEDILQRMSRILSILQDKENKEILIKNGLVNVEFNNEMKQVDMYFKYDNEKGKGTVIHSFNPRTISISSNNKQIFEVDSFSVKREETFSVSTLQTILNALYRKTPLSPQQYEMYYKTILKGYSLNYRVLKLI